MSNRAQRRAEQKKKPGMVKRLTKEQRINALLRQGISPADLDKAYQDGYEKGRLEGVDGTYKICFAAACLALNDLHSFGAKRCCDVMHSMQDYIINTLCSPEAVQKVYKRMGLTLNFGDPVAWISLEDD